MGILLLILVFLWICWKVYECSYYRSDKFIALKNRTQKYVNDCNDLNHHIENLKNTHLGTNQLDYGNSSYHDNSSWNYKRPELKRQKKAINVYNCSRSVCDNARKQPFKYICKYFNLKPCEETLNNVETVLNNFESVERGKVVLRNEKTEILGSLRNDIPSLIKLIGKRNFEKKIGFEPIDFSTTYFPSYIFQYTSSGGYASTQCDILMDINNLNRFIFYLSEVVKFKKSVAGQRALMTSGLRQKILARDNYTCKLCGISVRQEPNLLLEIDHIIPISKGGLTTESNLQTLCWKCNRKKGAKFSTPSTKKDLSTPVLQSPAANVVSSISVPTVLSPSQVQTDIIAADSSNASTTIKESQTMYNKEKGIYPAGQYLVGRDLPLGGYILTSRKDKTGYIQLYPSYEKFKKEEDAITYENFTEDYHISLMEENTYLVVDNADIQKI